MPNLQSRVGKVVAQAAGSTFWRTFILVSSDFTVAQKALTSAATGDLAIVECIVSTDSTGLAGMTNFEIGVSGETYGVDKPLVETQGNLGANASRSAFGVPPAADTTNDYGFSVTAVKFVLQAGDSLQYSGSGSVGTGAGKILVAIKFERLTEQADIVSAV